MNKDTIKLVALLKEQGLTLALAESVTCGLASHKLSNCPDTSEVFKGAVICYTPEIKKHVLGISQKKIDHYTCESKQVTEAMTKNLSRVVRADVYAGITGLASPGGSETKLKPVGTVFLSVKYKNKTYNLKQRFKGTPLEIKKKGTIALFNYITRIIKQSRNGNNVLKN